MKWYPLLIIDLPSASCMPPLQHISKSTNLIYLHVHDFKTITTNIVLQVSSAFILVLLLEFQSMDPSPDVVPEVVEAALM